MGMIAAAIFCQAAAVASTPIPTYGTYFGGTGDEFGAIVAVDSNGSIIVAGTTTSQSLPGTSKAIQKTRAPGFPNNKDVFLTKFDSTGHTVQWTTFLGGDGDDIPTGIYVDTTGIIYITGQTASTNFPVTFGSYMTAPTAGQAASFVSKVSADGTTLLASTYLSAFNATALTVNSTGQIYVVGSGPSSYASSGSVSQTASANVMLLLRLNSTASSLVFGASLGGANTIPKAIVLDALGNCYLGGYTTEATITTTADAYQSQYSNIGLTNLSGASAIANGFLLVLNADGTRIQYGTYFGARYSANAITAITLGSDGSVYFSGSTNETDFATTQGAYYSTPAGGFIGNITPGAGSLTSFSYLPAPAQRMKPVLSGTLGLLLVGSTTAAYTELTMPTLGLVGTTPVPHYSNDFAVTPTQTAAWVISSCYLLDDACAQYVTTDALQPKYTATSGQSDAGLILVTDIAPTIQLVGSAASFVGPFSAGQLVSIFGSQLGPTVGAYPDVSSTGVVGTQAGGTQVLFDGIPAPVLFSRGDQVNTAIPCSLAGRTSVTVVVKYRGAQSAPISLFLSPASPGIFTLTGTGKGQGAVLNQDYSINGPANPAERGSVVMVYATGLGAMTPSCTDGLIYQNAIPVSSVPAVAGLSTLGVQVLYSGQAPGAICGAAQVNVVIPADAPTGSTVPLSIGVGGANSQTGVTIAVR